MENDAGRLPLALTSFVGREPDLEALGPLLERERLVTLTGPGGIGKTRLALEVAGRRPRGAVPCLLVELASVTQPAGVAEAIAAVVCARDSASREGLDAIAARVGDAALLVILDNCEQVIDACAEAAGALLARCPGLRVLATSREPLRLPGETVWPVAPLEVPARPGPGGRLSMEVVAATDAVALFVARAGAARFTLTAAQAPAVAEICRRLDGIPLAIELAAARAGFITPDEIVARLDDPFRLLTTGSRVAAERHRTLLGALEWSHDLLSEAEATVFRRLAVFMGGFSLEAAEAVCAGAPGTTGVDPADVLDLVGRLAAQSLVACDPAAAPSRCWLLETVREFARQKLEASGEMEAVRDAHAAWCLAQAGAGGRSWKERAGEDYANFTAALAWTLEAGRPAESLALAVSLTSFWLARGRMREGSDWLERCLAAAPAAPPKLRSRALFGAGSTAGMLGDFERGISAGEESLRLARQTGERRGEARALNLLGFVWSYLDPARARLSLRESMEVAREAGDDRCVASSLALLGFVEVFQGDYTAARPYFDKCVEVVGSGGDEQSLRMALVGSGYVALQRAAFAASETALARGLELARGQEDTFWTAICLSYLGELSRIRGDYKQAAQWGDEAVATSRETGSTLALGYCLAFVGRARLEAGETAEARLCFEEALALPRGIGNPGYWPWALIGLGRAALFDGDQEGGPGGGGTAAAERFFDDGLAAAEARGHRLATAWGLLGSARFARVAGRPALSTELAQRSLDLGVEMAHPPGTAAALELIGGLALDEGRPDHAARLLGAAEGVRAGAGCACPPLDQPERDADLERAVLALGQAGFQAAWEQGRGLSPEEASAYARRGRGPRRRAASGWAGLTPAEVDVVRLVADGLTNVEIGQRLFVSPRTVQTHLAHVFAKVGLHSRRELARAAGPHLAALDQR